MFLDHAIEGDDFLFTDVMNCEVACFFADVSGSSLGKGHLISLFK